MLTRSRPKTRTQDWPVPTLHMDAATGADVLAAFKAGGAAASGYVSPQRVDPVAAEAPKVAGFSSRGPLLTDGSYLLKPDILAPGVEVFAALPGGKGGYWDGTSMATPHVTGIAALIKSKRPDWSAAAIKSALMTTANLTTNYGNPIDGAARARPHSTTGAAFAIPRGAPALAGPWGACAPVPYAPSPSTDATSPQTLRSNPTRSHPPHPTGTAFDYGAGLINPSAALDPGLVYDVSGIDAWHRYSCAAVNKRAWSGHAVGVDFQRPSVPGYCKSACRGGACAWPQALLDMNVPSFSFPSMKPGSTASARRALTYVGVAPSASFTPALALPAGYTGQVVLGGKLPRRGAPADAAGASTLPFSGRGEAQAFTLTVTAGRDAPKDWSFGSLVFTDAAGRYTVRSPIAIQRV
jgi:hypothetical protein